MEESLRGERATPEQERAVRLFLEGGDLKLVAVAGSGKTTTLRMMAERAGNRRLLYVAFNKSVRKEAEVKFPRNTHVHTLHSYAHQEVVVGSYRQKLSLGEKGLPVTELRAALEDMLRKAYPNPVERRNRLYVVKNAVERFLSTTAPEPGPEHIDPEFRDAKREKGTWSREGEVLVEAARLVWRKMRDPNDPFPLTHDGYVRIWYDRGGRIRGYDAVLVDEAQDLNPVFLEILNRSALQKVYVGDPRQQIYAWRGAVNAMSKIPAPEAMLTQSFRFGEGLARGVRAITRFLGGEVPVVGKAPWETEVGLRVGGYPDRPFAVLARTNAGVLEALVQLRALNLLPVHVVGGVKDVLHLLGDAYALQKGRERPNPHPELAGVSSWQELEELARQELNATAVKVVGFSRRFRDLRALMELVQASHVEQEEEAKVVLSTAHKAKGREWDRVVLWDDFPAVWEGYVRRAFLEAGKEAELREQENLLYVAMTRARELLLFEGGLEELYHLGWEGGAHANGDQKKPTPIPLQGAQKAQVLDLASRALDGVLAQAVGRVKALARKALAETRLTAADPRGVAHELREVLLPILSEGFSKEVERELGPALERALAAWAAEPSPAGKKDGALPLEGALDPKRESLGHKEKEALIHQLADAIASHQVGSDPERIAFILKNRVTVLGGLGEAYLSSLLKMGPQEAAEVYSRSSGEWRRYLATGRWVDEG
ncbi:UvrD-helicase domain-containing protein [Thermus filiformis]|uniref:UvrD-helicase domain-containing protein n=1 Tax=Thermus filiformis TaxID=276 RepID=UPI00069F6EFF|nr:UvrD-helicase domain-containing protein [Thermus filiformis]